MTGGGGGPIDKRLARDVFAYKPTVVTVMLGMNDASYQPFKQPIFDVYAKGYEHLVDSIKSQFPDVRLTLIQPSPYDDVTRKPNFGDGYNQVLIRYGEFVKELARKDGATVADLNTPVVAALKKAMEIDPDHAKDLIRDRVHPGPAGQLLMAEALLKAWNAPAVVSTVELDAAANKVVKQENTKVDNLKVERDDLLDAARFGLADAHQPQGPGHRAGGQSVRRRAGAQPADAQGLGPNRGEV